MDVQRIPQPDMRDPLQKAIDRIQLCMYAVQETHYELEPPQDPEHKADLLIAVEALALEAMDLLETTRVFVWGHDSDEEEDD